MPLLFNIALESVVRKDGVLFRNQGPLAFADDLGIVGNSNITVKEEFVKLKRSAKHVGLRIKQSKTKDMVTNRTEQTE